VKPLHHEFKFINEFIDESIKAELLEKIVIKNIRMNLLLYSRVPIQICTIENNMIIPLKDGVRENLNYLSSIENIIGKSKLITFGFIEQLIEFLSEVVSIKVVCIIGRQSSGKSYLMNRIFGTRFSVAATRCTDGIWLSYCYIGKQHFLILDCEGLFSIRRTEIEETKLMTLLSGICDVTILNQDLSFNRYMNKLFNSMSNAVDRINGKDLFKGIFYSVFSFQSYLTCCISISRFFVNCNQRCSNSRR
jgi:hypothetical protein